MVKEQTNVILDSIADGVFTIDTNWKITSFNRAAENITGVPREDALGSTCRDVFHSNLCDASCVLRQAIDQNQSITNRSVYIINAFGEQIPISISASPLKNKNGEIIGGVETFRDVSEVVELKKQLRQQYSFHDIISKSKSMRKLFGILPDIAQSESTVLIQGESGTGKELFAQAIHNLSRRSSGPFIVVNSGALPDTLLESELFGYKAGAFTDAKKDKPGRFSLAKGGTLFLDEIGDISPALQVRLLRVIQQKTFEPLGATKSEQADVRILTATNRDLAVMVREGGFREDLYYRLNVVPLHLAPLRERREDIPLLVEHFINRFNRLKNIKITGISESVLATLMQHSFPGNVRELENVIEYAFILCRDDLISLQHLPDYLQPQIAQNQFQEGLSLKEIQKQAVLLALNRNSWKRLKTARELKIDKGTLRRLIEKYELNPPE